MRIVIAGIPLAGKSTRAHDLATRHAMGAWHGDPYELDRTAPRCGSMCRHVASGLDWSDASAQVARWLSEPGPWIVEGVAAVRALRKWLEANRAGKPCDVVLWLRTPFVQLTPGQAAMAKGCEKVWAEVLRPLQLRGVEIQTSL